MNVLFSGSFYKKIFVSAGILVFIFGFAGLIKAQTADIPHNDFVLEPGKVEIFANPGESITKSITVTNRAATRISFKIEVEDFIGSIIENQPVVLLGNEKSPYSFKDNLIPATTTFSLDFNQSITIPIQVHIPANAQPGGFYASVLVSNAPSVDEGSQSTNVEGKTKIISRVGTLFFIRVNGAAKESGSLEDVKITYPTKDNPDTYKFNILFKNDGNVHLVPYGWVTVTDVFGKIVSKIPVDAYFALPHSIRYREVDWKAPSLFGRYEAKVELNRGYGSNLIDTKSVTFWVIHWTTILIGLAILLALFLAFHFFFKKFKFVAKE